MHRLMKAALVGLVIAVSGASSALATGGHDGGHGDHEYQDADCTPVDDANGDDSVQVFEERAHHGNGRTECVIASDDGQYPGSVCPDDQSADRSDCYIAYDPYQEDTEEGNSNGDRGPALRYHNGDAYVEDEHHSGMAGCFDPTGTLDPATAATQGEAEIQQELNEVLRPYTGANGYDRALADGWWPYPVPESKQFHMVRQVGAGDMHPDEPTWLHARNIEAFVIGMTDDGWQIMNGMFMLGNEGDEAPVYDEEGRVQTGPVDYKLLDDERVLPTWKSPYSELECDLMWHGHDGEQGVATSFDPEHLDISDWMAHVALYAAEGDPFGEERAPDSSEPHAYWEPYRRVPALCNPNGPCE